MEHADYMKMALTEALRAEALDEVPVGAIVVLDGRVMGTGYNQPIAMHDPTAHAEINAIRDAARTAGNYRLSGATLYSTIEPCLMCVGAMIHARIRLVVYGTVEPRSGALVSASQAHETPGLNHKISVVGGVLEEECRLLIQDFFKARRASSTSSDVTF